MITKAYIHEYGNGKMEPEHSDVKEVLESRGIECELFTIKRLNRNQLQLNKNTLVVGDNPTIDKVFKRIGYSKTQNSYPLSLRKYLKRTIWESTIKKLYAESLTKEISNIFIKPKAKAKLFTGFVIESQCDLYRLDMLSRDTELYCSSIVEWKSEYRVFVNQSKIIGIKHYEGDSNLKLNLNEVENAIIDFENSSNKTSAYGIDFGVLNNGETALIEWNDGFALGSYELDKQIYTDLILSRWNEVIIKTFANKV
ncbi:MAG: hypothetical protein COA58_13125 [Bacteroidetes bacterium]|nr:MAG: hypothetical protein COA58_13125 [Bacteroidota bacterium]